MDIAYIFAVLFCVSMVTGSPTGEASERPAEERAYTITFTNGKEEIMTIRGNEVKVEGPGEIKSVIDYDKHLITQMKPESKECLIVEFKKDSVPSLDDITKDLQQQQSESPQQESPQQPQPTYAVPTANWEMNIEESDTQTKPELSELSGQLCEGSTLKVYVEVNAAANSEVYEDNIIFHTVVGKTAVITFKSAVAS